MAKIILWDLEFMNLNANFGFIFCCGYKELGGKTRVMSIADYPGWQKEPSNDKRLITDVANVLGDADAWVTWYGKRCDVPYLNTRLLHHRLPPLPPVNHIDGWETARKKLRLHSNRLASLQDFLGTEGHKTPIGPEKWLKACSGDKRALNYITTHCRADVDVLEEVYRCLQPHINSPALSSVYQRGACPRCGDLSLRKRGMYRAATQSYQRYQCVKCGGWSRATASEKVLGNGATRVVAL